MPPLALPEILDGSPHVPLLRKTLDVLVPKVILEAFTFLPSLLSVITMLSPSEIVAVVVITPALVILPCACELAAAPISAAVAVLAALTCPVSSIVILYMPLS